MIFTIHTCSYVLEHHSDGGIDGPVQHFWTADWEELTLTIALTLNLASESVQIQDIFEKI